MGAWIEIKIADYYSNASEGRTPRWVRGLKLYHFELAGGYSWSHPTMGAWIEIKYQVGEQNNQDVAPHDGCVD